VSDKPTVVLLPGLDGTGRLFRGLVAALESEVRAQVISYPSERFLDYRELADLVAAQIPRGDFAIVAESFSGPVAALVGGNRPVGLRGVILSTSFVLPPAPGWLRFMPVGTLFRAGVPGWAVRRLLLGPGASPELVAEVAGAVSTVPPAVLAARLRAVLRANALESLRSCRAPVVYLWGSRDRLVGARGLHSIRRALPSVESIEVDGPHLLLQAKPAESAAVILQRVRRWFAS
jgi:pimeloyl-ACP methyl ester carboxylesterase